MNQILMKVVITIISLTIAIVTTIKTYKRNKQ